MDNEKVKVRAIATWNGIPHQNEFRSFLGLVNDYRRFGSSKANRVGLHFCSLRRTNHGIGRENVKRPLRT